MAAYSSIHCAISIILALSTKRIVNTTESAPLLGMLQAAQASAQLDRVNLPYGFATEEQ